MLLLGIDRGLFALFILVGMVVGAKISYLAAAIFFVGACAVAKYVTRKDPRVLQIWMQLFKMAPVYDPVKREAVNMQITD